MGFVVGLFSHAQAAIILDQSFSSPPNTFSQGIGKGEYGSPMLAQTFQVGVTGVLDSVEVYLCKIFSSATADLQLFIYSTSGGAPSTQVAAAPSLPASSVSTSYSFVSFNLSSASLPVTTGDLLAIVLKAEEPSGTNYGLTGGGGYGPGQKFSNIGGGWSGSSEDLYFRTFVDGVPEPSALVLLGMGAVGLLEFAWRRRKCLT